MWKTLMNERTSDGVLYVIRQLSQLNSSTYHLCFENGVRAQFNDPPETKFSFVDFLKHADKVYIPTGKMWAIGVTEFKIDKPLPDDDRKMLVELLSNR